MKRCGYQRGYCRIEGQCDVGLVSMGEIFGRKLMSKRVAGCKYRALTASDWTTVVRLHQRRRDWKIGNPHDRA